MSKLAKGLNLTGNTIAAKDDAFLYHLISGKSGVFNYGNKLSYQTVSANLIKIKDGMAQLQGRNFIIYPSETVDVKVESGTQGNKRNDIIVLEFTKTSSNESIEIKCIKGTPSTGNATDPKITQQDTLASGTTYQLPLYRVKLNGINVEGVDDLRVFIPSMNDTVKALSYTDGVLTVEIPDSITYKSLSDVSDDTSYDKGTLDEPPIMTLEEPIIKEKGENNGDKNGTDSY